MGAGEMADGRRGQVAVDYLQAGVTAALGGDDLGRELAADGASAENAGIDVQQLFGHGSQSIMSFGGEDARAR
jgi:hypothetical protein